MAQDAADPHRQFPRPPVSFTDREGREIEIRTADGDDAESLIAMYDAYTDADRAQGIPPRRTSVVEDWARGLLDDGLNLVAWHGEESVGHAALIPYDETSELVIFVHPDYHHAGIGSQLIRVLLGYGQAEGIDHVWLSVERDNHVAMNLYRSVGFETTDRNRKEHEMERDL